MTREVPEWVGKRDETPPPPRVKARIVTRQDGICACGCGVKLGMAGERIEFDHHVALVNGGENAEGNLRALREPCHKVKTRADVAEKSTVARKRARHLGLIASKNPLPGGKGSKFKRKINGPTVLREEDQ